MKAAVPVRMWAAIVRGTRGEWIQPYTVRPTRKKARTAYLADYDTAWLMRPGNYEFALRNVRFARVTVTLEPAS